MIRRGFWLVTGAAVGIYGYRRVAAVGRRVSGTRSATRNGQVTPGRVAKETFRFARDVREGMELYSARQHAPSGSTLPTTDHDAQPEDGR
jgi:hypothetical protein